MSIEARRHSPRAKLNETAYINFESGSRGVVLDVSEGGLRFQTTSPLQGIETVRCWLTSDHRSEAVADLVWSDESHTTGGLHFTSLPQQMHQQIRIWIDRSLSAPIVLHRAPSLNAEEMAAPGGRAEQAGLQPNESVGATQEVSPQPVTLETAREETAEEPAIETTPDPVDAAPPPLVSDSPREDSSALPKSTAANEPKLSMFLAERTAAGGYSFTTPPSSHHRLAIAALVLLLVLAAAAGAAAYFYPRQTQDAMNRVQAKITRFLNSVRKQPISNVEPAAMGGSPADNSKFAGTLQSVSPAPDASTSADGSRAATEGKERERAGDRNGRTNPTRNKNEGDLTLAQSYLAPSSTPQEKAKAVELLWHATEKGNVDAEIQLADLYTRGVAVPKSCEQARILLKAAAVANPALAQPKLAELDKTGCN